MYILNEEYLQIEVKDNKLIYYSKLNIIPNEEDFNKIVKVLTSYMTAIEKSKKPFYQIMLIDNATLTSIYNYTTVISWICNFFMEQHPILEKYLLCTVIIIDNTFIKNAINLVLKTYTSVRPVHFITDLDELDPLLKLY